MLRFLTLRVVSISNSELDLVYTLERPTKISKYFFYYREKQIKNYGKTGIFTLNPVLIKLISL
jgi:hypothetical protein